MKRHMPSSDRILAGRTIIQSLHGLGETRLNRFPVRNIGQFEVTVIAKDKGSPSRGYDGKDRQSSDSFYIDILCIL